MKKIFLSALTALMLITVLSACNQSTVESEKQGQAVSEGIYDVTKKEGTAENGVPYSYNGAYTDGTNYLVFTDGEVIMNGQSCEITSVSTDHFSSGVAVVYFTYNGNEISAYYDSVCGMGCSLGQSEGSWLTYEEISLADVPSFDIATDGSVTTDNTSVGDNNTIGREPNGEVVAQLDGYKDKLGYYECSTGDDYKLIELHETGIYYNHRLVSFTENQTDGMLNIYDLYGVYEYGLYFDGNTLYCDLGEDFYNYQPYSYTTTPKSWYSLENYIGTFISEDNSKSMTILENGAFTYTDGDEIYSLMLPERLVIDQEFNVYITFSIESDNGAKDTFRVAHVMGGDFEDDPNRIEVRTGTGFTPYTLYREGEQIENNDDGENVSANENIYQNTDGNNGLNGTENNTNTGTVSYFYCAQDPATISVGSEVLFANLTYSQDGSAYPYQLSLGFGDDVNALNCNWYVSFSGFGETQISTQYWGAELTAEMAETVTLGGSLDCLELTIVSTDGTLTNYFNLYPFDHE